MQLFGGCLRCRPVGPDRRKRLLASCYGLLDLDHWPSRVLVKEIPPQLDSGERNTAPAWCFSSWHDASLKQKPPALVQNRRKLASLGVQGRIIFHGPLQQLTHGRIFFHPGPVYGHRIHQQSSDWGAGRSAAVCRASPADEGRCHVGGVEVGGRMSGLKGDRVCKRNPHARLVRSACVNKFALHAKKCPNWAFYGVLGEFCTGGGVGGGVLGEFCTGCAVVDR